MKKLELEQRKQEIEKDRLSLERQRADIEQKKLEIESKKLELDGAKADLEAKRSRWATIGIGVPVICGLLTVWSGFTNTLETAKVQLATKLVDVGVQSEDTTEAMLRIRPFLAMFKEYLPRTFEAQLSALAKDYDLPYTHGANQSQIASQKVAEAKHKKELFAAIAKNPEKADEVIHQYARLFPDESWVIVLERSAGRQR